MSPVCRRTKNPFIPTKSAAGSSLSGDPPLFTTRLGLLLSAVQKNVFLSLCYWRDILARQCSPRFFLTPSEDESPEAILPLDAIARIVYDMPQNSIPAVMAHRSPQQMAKIPLISELWNRVQEVKSGKMAVFAVLVEEAARKVVVTVETDWHVGGNRGNLSVLAVGQLHGIGRFIRSEKLPICARKQPVSSAEHGGDSAAAE